MDREQAPESAPPAWWWGGAVLGVVISAVLAWQLHRVAGAAFADAGLGALPWLVLALGLVATALLAVGYRRIAGVRAEMAHSLALRASALAETETRFASAFEHVAVGMTHIALDGQWLRVNATLCSMVGYPREELLGKGFAGITHPDDLPRDLAAKTAMSRGEIDQYVAEKRYFHRDGHAIWVRVVVSPVLVIRSTRLSSSMSMKVADERSTPLSPLMSPKVWAPDQSPSPPLRSQLPVPTFSRSERPSPSTSKVCTRPVPPS